MTTRQRVENLAKKLGATIEFDHTEPHIYADAPKGMCWSCDPGLHGLVAVPEEGETIESRWKDIYDRMKFGIEECRCSECKEPPAKTFDMPEYMRAVARKKFEEEYDRSVIAMERVLGELLASPFSAAARDRATAAIQVFWIARRQRIA